MFSVISATNTAGVLMASFSLVLCVVNWVVIKPATGETFKRLVKCVRMSNDNSARLIK